MDRLCRIFEVICFNVSFLVAQPEHQVDAQKLVASVSKQLKETVDLLDLAKIKYLMPEDVVFELRDTPFYSIQGEAPHKILVFEFAEKSAPRTRKSKSGAKILHRIEKFRQALKQFGARRQGLAFEELDELARSCLPHVPSPPPPPLRVDSRTIEEIVDQLKDKVSAVRTIPGREAVYGPDVDTAREVCEQRNIDKLYVHQSEALAAINSGKHIVVTTSTASGKSLIFQSPVVHELSKHPNSTAIFIYPTKALAQDQKRLFPQGYRVETFDGDTDFKVRDEVAKCAQIIFVNPDILHCTLLPHWQKYQRILENCRYVVIDELHYYSGLFGGNVAMVIRRLRRLCYHLGNDNIQFIACSATVERPLDLFTKITGLEIDTVTLISKDGSPSGRKHYLYVSPPPIVPDNPECGLKHPISEATTLLITIVAAGLRVMAFCRTRKDCELLIKSVKSQLKKENRQDLEELIMSYRGGYSPQERRKIERDMFDGHLYGIIATSALEVGIDLGNLDAAIIVGFPYSLSSFRQQVGRVGRRSNDSLVAYVADGSILDQTYICDPDKLFVDKDPVIPLSLEGPVIDKHVQCAAAELALAEDDAQFFPGDWNAHVEKLDFDNGLWYCTPSLSKDSPGRSSIRNVEERSTAIIDVTNQKNELLEVLEFSRVRFTLYENAIFLHRGVPYLVIDLDPDLVYAKVQKTDADWTTRQRDYTDVDPLKSIATEHIASVVYSWGTVLVTNIVFGYFKVDRFNNIFEAQEVNMPPFVGIRRGLWLNIPGSILDTLSVKFLHVAGAIHAVEHTVLCVIPQFVAAARNDMATECKAPEKELMGQQTTRVRPSRIIVYEQGGGELGNGIMERAFEVFPEILVSALRIIDGCKCTLGCLHCVADPFCTEHNAVLSKWGAQVILRQLLSMPIDNIPDGPEPNMPETNKVTVVPVGAESFKVKAHLSRKKLEVSDKNQKNATSGSTARAKVEQNS